jgi:hypothetical protein
MIQNKKFSQLFIVLLLLLTLTGQVLAGCAKKEISYRYAEIYLDCENYSIAQNDPGNCQAVSGTSSGLRVQDGMIVSKEYVAKIMSDLGWTKVSQTTKYKDVNGVSYRLDVFTYKREVLK